MQRKVQNYIEKHHLLTPGAKIVVGVSGGADSVALLHLLHSLAYDCIIAHCNFHLRMDESDRDETFVRNMASELKIPYYSIDFETTKYAEAHKVSIEMAARDLRYAWFEELRLKLNAEAILVAHHADDSIETLLMNLVRGTGLRGMTGIPARNGNVVRPLLCCSREEILNYLIKYDLEYVEDSTNASSDYTRNKFRNEVLPLLEKINPSVRQTLYKTVERFEDIEGVFNQAISEITTKIVIKSDKTTKIDVLQLKSLDNYSTVLFEILSPFGFNSTVVENISDCLNNDPGQLFYTTDFTLLHDRDYLIIFRNKENKNQQYTINESDTFLTLPFKMDIQKIQITNNFLISKSKNLIHLDAEKLKFPLTLRHWQEGDSFVPFGMKQRKKLSDYFIDEKFTRFEKDACWLLISDTDIVWVVGHRTDNRFRVNDSTTQVISFSI